MFRLRPRLPALRPRTPRRLHSTAPAPAVDSLIPPHTFKTSPYKPPPLSARLRPLIPFFISWTIVTSLIVHLLRTRLEREEMLARQSAKVGVLEGLVERVRRGEAVDDAEVQREMELVGLRKKGLHLASEEEIGPRGREYVGWKQVFLGRRAQGGAGGAGGAGEGAEVGEGEQEEKTIEQGWAEVVEAAESTEKPPGLFASLFSAPKTGRVAPEVLERERNLEAKRAPSSSAYL